MHVPNECNREGTSVENEANNDVNNEISGDYDSDIKSAIGEHNDRNHNKSGDVNRIAEGNVKESNQCPFEMIDNIANAMKKLENIVIDCYSDSDNSEKLSERQ